jgi:hypothetical protein
MCICPPRLNSQQTSSFYLKGLATASKAITKCHISKILYITGIPVLLNETGKNGPIWGLKPTGHFVRKTVFRVWPVCHVAPLCHQLGVFFKLELNALWSFLKIQNRTKSSKPIGDSFTRKYSVSVCASGNQDI